MITLQVSTRLDWKSLSRQLEPSRQGHFVSPDNESHLTLGGSSGSSPAPSWLGFFQVNKTLCQRPQGCFYLRKPKVLLKSTQLGSDRAPSRNHICLLQRLDSDPPRAVDRCPVLSLVAQPALSERGPPVLAVHFTEGEGRIQEGKCLCSLANL